MNVETGVIVITAGGLRRLTGPISNQYGIDDRPDDHCLCRIDIKFELEKSGFEAWYNPRVIPEILFRKKDYERAMTEQTMIERVSRLICGKSWIAKYKTDELRSEAIDKHWPEFIDIARATIEEIRDPTDAMLTAGWKEVDVSGVWNAMIDAALAEQ